MKKEIEEELEQLNATFLLNFEKKEATLDLGHLESLELKVMAKVKEIDQNRPRYLWLLSMGILALLIGLISWFFLASMREQKIELSDMAMIEFLEDQQYLSLWELSSVVDMELLESEEQTMGNADGLEDILDYLDLSDIDELTL